MKISMLYLVLVICVCFCESLCFGSRSRDPIGGSGGASAPSYGGESISLEEMEQRFPHGLAPPSGFPIGLFGQGFNIPPPPPSIFRLFDGPFSFGFRGSYSNQEQRPTGFGGPSFGSTGQGSYSNQEQRPTGFEGPGFGSTGQGSYSNQGQRPTGFGGQGFGSTGYGSYSNQKQRPTGPEGPGFGPIVQGRSFGNENASTPNNGNGLSLQNLLQLLQGGQAASTPNNGNGLSLQNLLQLLQGGQGVNPNLFGASNPTDFVPEGPKPASTDQATPEPTNAEHPNEQRPTGPENPGFGQIGHGVNHGNKNLAPDLLAASNPTDVVSEDPKPAITEQASPEPTNAEQPTKPKDDSYNCVVKDWLNDNPRKKKFHFCRKFKKQCKAVCTR